jgi:hypothetical protein
MATHDQILDGWMIGFARDGWTGARIDGVAELSGATAAEVAAAYPDHWTALRGYQARLDTAALAEAGSDRDASVRDRLFALLMARFDAGEDHKAAAHILVEAAPRDPGLAAFMLATLPVSVARLAEAAGVATGGWLGPLRVHALAALVLHVSRTWLDDSDPDLAATMKALDTALERAERYAAYSPA